MRARIRKEGNFWIGEVYGNWTILFFHHYTGWISVTPNCFTKLGAKYELRKWIKENVPEEYDI